MTFWIRSGVICLAWICVFLVNDLARSWKIASISQISSAIAEVGRPLTPVSIAGVARRSARR